MFLVALAALRERLRRASGGWGDVSVLFGLVGVVIYLVGHTINVAWGPELIRGYARAGALTSTTATQYVMLSRIYSGAMLGGSVFTGLALVIIGALALRTRVLPQGLGALAIVGGALDVAGVVRMLAPALPLTGAVLIWLGICLWRDAPLEESR